MITFIACVSANSALVRSQERNRKDDDGEPEQVAAEFVIGYFEHDVARIQRVIVPSKDIDIFGKGPKVAPEQVQQWKDAARPERIRRVQLGEQFRLVGEGPVVATDKVINANALLVRTANGMSIPLVRTANGWKVDASPFIRSAKAAEERRNTDRAAAEAADKVLGKLDSQRYVDQSLHFSIQFPQGFEKIPWDRKEAAVLYRDASGANINIRLVRPPKPVPAGLIMAMSREGLKKSGLINLKELGFGELLRAQESCAWLLMAHGPSEKRMRAMSYILVRGGDAAFITATANENIFDGYRPLFDACARTFHFELPR
ncbi:MAG TPA: hypothetical protein VIK18_10560 [Pirellulales bacterium]